MTTASARLTRGTGSSSAQLSSASAVALWHLAINVDAALALDVARECRGRAGGRQAGGEAGGSACRGRRFGRALMSVARVGGGATDEEGRGALCAIR